MVDHQGKSVEGEAVVVGDMPPPSTRQRVLVELGAAAPSLLPVGAPRVRPVLFRVPPVDDNAASVTPLPVDPLMRRRQREQPFLPCTPRAPTSNLCNETVQI
ncbi:hypothetical protein GW17_00010793 [Ensete ventricosum]|nr:hypothetical protein GW17_00010793 [Ensete ventricosum]